jgi:hypothetical protein
VIVLARVVDGRPGGVDGRRSVVGSAMDRPWMAWPGGPMIGPVSPRVSTAGLVRERIPRRDVHTATRLSTDSGPLSTAIGAGWPVASVLMDARPALTGAVHSA